MGLRVCGLVNMMLKSLRSIYPFSQYTNSTYTVAFRLINPLTRQLANASTILISSFLLFSLSLLSSGCSAPYNAERLFWHAQRQAAPLLKDSSKADPKQVEQTISAFKRIVERFPETVWAARAHVVVGTLYATQAQYEKAREAFRQVLQNYYQYSSLCLSCRLAIAKTYELEQSWEDAIKSYEAIMEQHPMTQMGLEVPLYIARIYAQRGEPEKAQSAYERAVQIYVKLIPTAPMKEKTLQIKGYLAMAYRRLGQGKKAAELFEELLSVPQGINRPYVLLSLGRIYQVNLHDEEKALWAYNQLVQEAPEHPFAQVAKRQLEEMKDAKNPAAPQAQDVGLPPSTLSTVSPATTP